MRAAWIPLVAVVAGCARLPDPPPAGDTPFAREQMAIARAARDRPPGEEAKVLRASVAALEPAAAAARRDVDEGGEAEGLLALGAPGARETVAKARDPAAGDALLAAGPLDLETVLLAAYARNPDVEAARATWRSTVRLYDQASALEDVLLRYRAFARLSTAPAAAKGMGEAAFPYPGVLALKGEMVAAEVRMARESARMRLRDVLAEAAMAYAGLAARTEEASLRAELVALADRLLASARARVRAGTGTQAELLELEAERAMLENDRLQAIAAGTEAGARLNTLLARAPTAAIAAKRLPDPPATTPDVAALLALADRYAPEPRMARAEAERTAVAIRMSEAMLLAAPPPGAGAGLGMPAEGGGDDMGAAAPSGMPAPAAGGAMGGMAAPGGGARGAAAAPKPVPGGDVGPSPAPVPGVPAALGSDLAWVAELRERRVALERKVEEDALAASRGVVTAHLDLDSARRMHALAASSTVPLATQAVEERMRLYESGRAGFAEVFAALRRVVDARLGAVAARQMYAEAEAKTWMAAGARPSVAAGDSGGAR